MTEDAANAANQLRDRLYRRGEAMTETRVLVTGSRDWPDPAAVHDALDFVAAEYGHQGLVVVHGHCPTGADAHADAWAHANASTGVAVERHPADWERLGKRAGPVRNAEMVDLGADVCLAFIKSGSRGASHTARLAEDADIPVRRWLKP